MFIQCSGFCEGNGMEGILRGHDRARHWKDDIMLLCMHECCTCRHYWRFPELFLCCFFPPFLCLCSLLWALVSLIKIAWQVNVRSRRVSIWRLEGWCGVLCVCVCMCVCVVWCSVVKGRRASWCSKWPMAQWVGIIACTTLLPSPRFKPGL